MRFGFSLACSIFAAWSQCLSGSEPAQWIVVTPPPFRETLQPLIDQRRGEGLKVVVLDSSTLRAQQVEPQDPSSLPLKLHDLCHAHPGATYILLVGVIEDDKAKDRLENIVPTQRGTIERMKQMPTDFPYGMPGSNGMPTVAVGRFPARDVAELRAMVSKTLRHSQAVPGTWQNHLFLVGGNPGGGRLAEMMVEQATQPRLARLHPAWTLRAIVNSDASRYYLPEPALLESISRSWEEGALFSIYLGHSQANALWLGGRHFINHEAWQRLRIPQGGGVFFTCGCFSCQWSGPNGEGYAFVAMRNESGPAAVIGASGESYAAPGLLALDGLLTVLAQSPQPRRLAEYWLATQDGLARGNILDTTFQLYDQFDGSRGKTSLATQRREHLEMWMLLGDPAMVIRAAPTEIVMEVEGASQIGAPIKLTGIIPNAFSGTVRVSLERSISASPTLEPLPGRSSGKSEERDLIAARNHKKANNVQLQTAEVESRDGQFSCSLSIPPDYVGSDLVLRAVATNSNDYATGVLVLPLIR